MNNILQNLKDIGFDEKDAKVYFALLKLGQSGSSAVIKEAELHGQFVYNSLKRLEKAGLVSVSVQNGRNKYLAASPYKILNRIKEKERLASEVIEDLNKMLTVQNYQEVTTFIGEEEFRRANYEDLEMEQIGGELMIIGGSGDRFMATMSPLINKYHQLWDEKNIRARYIANESQRDEMLSIVNSWKRFEVRILPGLNTGLVNTRISTNQILLNIYGVPLYLIRIQNKTVTESYKNFFENIWKLSKPL